MHPSWFGRFWREMAADSLVDGYGGAEYRRVLASWGKARYPGASPDELYWSILSHVRGA
jgi:hypothetical protein